MLTTHTAPRARGPTNPDLAPPTTPPPPPPPLPPPPPPPAPQTMATLPLMPHNDSRMTVHRYKTDRQRPPLAEVRGCVAGSGVTRALAPPSSSR